jgi:hypothetical protein
MAQSKGRKVANRIIGEIKKEQGRQWAQFKASKRGVKPKRPGQISGSVSYYISRIIKALAYEYAQHEEVKAIVASRKPRRYGASANLVFPHYWMRFYHDGFRGGKKKRGVWLFFPDRIDDPRRPSLARQEKRRSQIKKMGKLGWKELKKRGAIFTKRRKGWKGDPFLDNATADFWRNKEHYLKDVVDDLLYLEFSKLVKRSLSRFGMGIKARGPRPRGTRVRVIHFYDPIIKGITGGSDSYAP